MNKNIIIAIAAIVVATILGGAYYLVEQNKISSDRQKANKELLEAQQESKIKTNRQADLDQCLNDAGEEYQTNWTRNVKVFGNSTDDTLPAEVGENVDSGYKEIKDDCFRQYN